MLSDPAPRPPRCYDPATPPHRDEQGVPVYDHATIRGLLRDRHRVRADVSELLNSGPARPAAPGEQLRVGDGPHDV